MPSYGELCTRVLLMLLLLFVLFLDFGKLPLRPHRTLSCRNEKIQTFSPGIPRVTMQPASVEFESRISFLQGTNFKDSGASSNSIVSDGGVATGQNDVSLSADGCSTRWGLGHGNGKSTINGSRTASS